MQEPSIFTRIINGEIPCHKIYEDDRVIAFLDLHPSVDGHTLVVPKKQINHIWDLDDDDYSNLWLVAKKIAEHMQMVMGSPRIGVIVEGFGVPHTHIHLMPIYKADDIKTRQDHSVETDHEKLAKLAEQLKM